MSLLEKKKFMNISVNIFDEILRVDPNFKETLFNKGVTLCKSDALIG